MPITESNSQGTRVTLRNGTPSKVSQSQTYSKTQTTTRRTYDERYPWSSFLKIPTFVILFVMVMIGSSVMFYNANIDTYMPTLDAEGVRQPYRVEYLNDQPIAELNGLTLNEVFENNNIRKDLSTWYKVNLTNSIYTNEVFNIESDLTNLEHYLYITNTLNDVFNANDYYYQRFTIDSATYQYIKIETHWFNGSSYTANHYPWASINVIGNYSYKQQVPSQYNETTYQIRFQLYTSTARLMTGNGKVGLKENYLINMTSLDIDNLTKEQMDYYYNLYQEQDGVTFDNYYYLSTEDYSALGQTAVTGYEVAFNEGGIFDSALNLVGTVQDVLMQAVNTLQKAYTWLSWLIFDSGDDDVFNDQLDRFGTEYEDIPKNNLEATLKDLPKWMKFWEWFD